MTTVLLCSTTLDVFELRRGNSHFEQGLDLLWRQFLRSQVAQSESVMPLILPLTLGIRLGAHLAARTIRTLEGLYGAVGRTSERRQQALLHMRGNLQEIVHLTHLVGEGLESLVHRARFPAVFVC